MHLLSAEPLVIVQDILLDLGQEVAALRLHSEPHALIPVASNTTLMLPVKQAHRDLPTSHRSVAPSVRLRAASITSSCRSRATAPAPARCRQRTAQRS